jgi:biopolymer transport protein ExbB/TolQ
MFISDIIIAATMMTLGLTLGSVAALIVFVRRQRQALINALNTNGKHHLATAQHLAQAIESTQRQQRQYEQQLQNLAQATLRLRQEVEALNKRAERSADNTVPRPERVIH